MRGLVGSQSYASWAMASIFAFLPDSGLSPSDEAFNKVVSSLSVALTAQAKASYAASAFLKQIGHETYVAHLPAHTHDSVKHALCQLPRRIHCSPRKLFNVPWVRLGMIPSSSFYIICLLRGVRRVRPPLLPLLPSVVVVLPFRSSLRLPLPGSPRISLGALLAIRERLLLLPFAVVHRNALLGRLPRRRRIFASRSYVPRLLW